jgi:predicted Zn-dependent protease
MTRLRTILCIFTLSGVGLVGSGCINLPKLGPSEGPQVVRLRQVVKDQPDNVHAHFMLGKEALGRGDAPAAEKSFRRAIELKPDFEEAHYGLGVALLDQGETSAAIAHFEAMRTAMPKSLAAREGLAAAKLNAADLDGAEQTAKASFADGLTSPQLHRLLGEVAYARSRHAEALDHFKQAAAGSTSLRRELDPLITDLEGFVGKYGK